MQAEFGGLISQIALLHHQFGAIVDTTFLVFCRMLGFVMVAPILGRKDIPFNIKLGIAFLMSFVLAWHLPGDPIHNRAVTMLDLFPYLIQIFANITVGLLIGFIGSMIMECINSAGSLMNNQIGLSSAMMFDPSSRQQVALTEKLTGYIGLMVFLHLGGFYWLINALNRTFEVFPIQGMTPDFASQISIDYLIQLGGNSLAIGAQLIAPVLIVTITVDLMLGIVNRTAQQIQVFQLSFALKPCIGLGVFLATLPIFIKLLEHYLNDHAAIF